MPWAATSIIRCNQAQAHLCLKGVEAALQLCELALLQGCHKRVHLPHCVFQRTAPAALLIDLVRVLYLYERDCHRVVPMRLVCMRSA